MNRGLTVIELCLLLAMASALLAVLVPEYNMAKERASQKCTIADMEMWNSAVSFYINDHSAAPANPNGPVSFDTLITKQLAPYLEAVRVNDWWGYPFRIWTGENIREYGISTRNEKDYIIASFGKEGHREPWRYDKNEPDSGCFDLSEPDDFRKDIVLWNGRFVRHPRKDHDPQ